MGERADQAALWTSLGLQTMTVEGHKCFSGEPGTAVKFPLTLWVSFEDKDYILGF